MLKKLTKLISLLLCLSICFTAISACTQVADSAEPTVNPSTDIALPSSSSGSQESATSTPAVSAKPTTSVRPSSGNIATATPTSGTTAKPTQPSQTTPSSVVSSLPTKTPAQLPTNSPAATKAPALQPTTYPTTNWALGKSATADSILPGYNPSYAFDGDPNTMWASTATDKNPYLQVDLGRAYVIGSVEILHRPDASNINSGERTMFEIQVSNDPSFGAYKVIGEQGTLAFDVGTNFVCNSGSTTKYRYVRLQRTHGATHITIAEMRVFSNNIQVDPERPIEAAPSGALQIISKASGKALAANGSALSVTSYTFRNSQRWIMENAIPGYAYLKNAATNTYLTYNGTALSLAAKTGADSQLWSIRPVDGDWRIITCKSGGTLYITNGALAVRAQSTGIDDEKWDVNTAYIENIKKADALWLNDGYGVMYHLLAASNNKSHMNRKVDVDAICQQLEDLGVTYFTLSFGQNSGYYIASNDKFQSIITQNVNSRFTNRDIFREFAENLKRRGIKLIAYTTTCPPTGYTSDIEAFLMGRDNLVHSNESAMLWSMVLREWSLEYGDLISGWWVDGSYSSTVPSEDVLTMLANAMKAGNPNAVVAFNPGVLISEHGRPREGLYPADLWAKYVKEVLSQGGAICLDVDFSTDDYMMLQSMYDILKEIRQQYYG